MRKAFNFFRSYYDVAMELNDKDRLAFYDAVLNKQFNNLESELNGMAKFAYLSQKHSIDSQVKGYFDKTKDDKFNPNQPPSVGGTKGGVKAPSVQEQEKEKEKGKEQLKDNIKDRKTSFANSLKPFLEFYDKEMLNNFYLYWTEHGDKDKKMRYEKEKSFDIRLRLSNWSKRSETFKAKEFKKEVLFVTPEGIEITDKLALHVYQQTGKV